MEHGNAEQRLTLVEVDGLREYLSKHREGEYFLVDVREPVEYEMGHIPGATLIPLGEVESRIEELEPAKDAIFYCRSGKRSRAAAAMAVDSGRFSGAVYSFEGGFMAWDGKTLEDFPEVKAFENVQGIEEALKVAMEMEKGAWRFYRGILERYPDSSFATVCQELAELEHRHAEVVYRYLRKHSESGVEAPFEDLFAELPGDILEGGEPMEKALQRASSWMGDENLSFSELALDVEYRAYDLYRNLWMDASDADEKEVFLSLAEQEKGHVRVVARHLQRSMK